MNTYILKTKYCRVHVFDIYQDLSQPKLICLPEKFPSFMTNSLNSDKSDLSSFLPPVQPFRSYRSWIPLEGQNIDCIMMKNSWKWISTFYRAELYLKSTFWLCKNVLMQIIMKFRAPTFFLRGNDCCIE